MFYRPADFCVPRIPDVSPSVYAEEAESAPKHVPAAAVRSLYHSEMPFPNSRSAAFRVSTEYHFFAHLSISFENMGVILANMHKN